MSVYDMLGDRGRYFKAQDGIADGTIHTLTAVALVATDPDFIAEFELRARGPLTEAARFARARQIVENWQKATLT